MTSGPWRIGLWLLPLLLVCLLLLGFGLVVLDRGGRALARIEAINRELAATLTLEAATARYALRVAQVMEQGREQQEDLRTARLGMERGFVRLTQEARDQAAAASDDAEARDLLTDVENTRRMLELYHAIDLSASRAFVLARDGSLEEARRAYQREVDFRLRTEFAALLDDALASRQQRLATERSRWEERSGQARAAAAGLLFALIAAGASSWLLLSRHAKAAEPRLLAAIEQRAEELRHANRRLRETDARRAQFLADVSHELRTPLTILRGEADVALLQNADPQDQRRSLERIQDQAAELAQLLDDLIAFARSDADAQPLAMSRILFDDVLAAVVEEGEMLAEPREVTITLALKDKGQWVDADMRRLKQALIIGIDNAINHSPPGSMIEVELTRSSDTARATILDRGPGLAEGEQPRVFDRFYRGANAGYSSGLGIGLAIAKAIIDQHNGSIELANRPGGGAALMIDLPLPKEARA